jgi:LytTr DNA-binding domain
MTKHQFFKIIYWIMVSVMIAILLQNSIPYFWNAWLIALFFLPAALIVKFGIDKTRSLNGFKKLVRYFFIAVISLYWGYVAVTVAYWYFLELKADSLEKILINPLFIWVIIGFFVLLEYIIFKGPNKGENKTITIYSDRKRTTIKINNLAYIESRADFTLAILIDGSEYKNTIRISEWEQKLNGFLRVHRSFLVNPDFSTINGNVVIVNAQWHLPISRSYKQKVMDYFNNSAAP